MSKKLQQNALGNIYRKKGWNRLGQHRQISAAEKLGKHCQGFLWGCETVQKSNQEDLHAFWIKSSSEQYSWSYKFEYLCTSSPSTGKGIHIHFKQTQNQTFSVPAKPFER